MGEEEGSTRRRRARERLASLWPRGAEPPFGRRSLRGTMREVAHTARLLLTRGYAAPQAGEQGVHEGDAAGGASLGPRSREALDLRDEILAIVSHDLRNPLNTISICATLLADTLPRAARTREVMRRLDVIRQSVDQMERLIQDLLDAARADSGRLELEPHEFRLAPLLAEALLTLQPLAAEKAQRLELAVADDAPLVRADRQRTIQIVSNLVGNAIKFTPPGGRVALRARRTGPHVTVCIEDSGAGIAPEDLPHIFERFWQARHDRRTGAGLGLAIARSIVEAQGGRIWAESRPGRGARFFFTLPLAPGGAPPR